MPFFVCTCLSPFHATFILFEDYISPIDNITDFVKVYCSQIGVWAIILLAYYLLMVFCSECFYGYGSSWDDDDYVHPKNHYKILYLLSTGFVLYTVLTNFKFTDIAMFINSGVVFISILIINKKCCS